MYTLMKKLRSKTVELFTIYTHLPNAHYNPADQSRNAKASPSLIMPDNFKNSYFYCKYSSFSLLKVVLSEM